MSVHNISVFQMFNSHQLESGKLGDYCDAEQFRNHPLFKNDPGALQVTLYYDDLEVCNPLGSKAKIHKHVIHKHYAKCTWIDLYRVSSFFATGVHIQVSSTIRGVTLTPSFGQVYTASSWWLWCELSWFGHIQSVKY